MRARWGVGLVFFVNGAAFASWVSRIPGQLAPYASLTPVPWLWGVGTYVGMFLPVTVATARIMQAAGARFPRARLIHLMGIAWLVAAPVDPTGDSIGVIDGERASVPPAVFVEAGALAQLRIESLLVRADLAYGIFPAGNLQMAQASIVAAWVFTLPPENMDVFVGAGPSLGFLRTTFDGIAVPGALNDSSHHVSAGFGGIGMVGYGCTPRRGSRS